MNELTLKRSSNKTRHFLAGTFITSECRGIIAVIATIVLATLLRLPLHPLIGYSSPFLFYIPGVFLISALFGFNLGLITTIASLIPANYFLMFPENCFGIDLVEGIQMATFSFVGIAVSWLSHKSQIGNASKERIRSTLASLNDAIISTDATGRISYLNAKAQLLTGLTAEADLNRLISEAVEFTDANGQDSLSDTVRCAIQADDLERLPSEIMIWTSLGTFHKANLDVSRILGSKGQMLGVTLVLKV